MLPLAKQLWNGSSDATSRRYQTQNSFDDTVADELDSNRLSIYPCIQDRNYIAIIVDVPRYHLGRLKRDASCRASCIFSESYNSITV